MIKMTDFFTAEPGETAAPLPPGPILCTGTAGMRRIHRFFLWAYDEAPGLVRSTATGDTARAAYVGEVLGNYEELSALLKVHLRREVTEVMPVVDRVLSEKEMNAVGQHGIDQFEKKFLVSYLGMVLATNPPQDRKELFKEIPALVRLAYRVVGRRMYRRQYSALFPGREVPATL